MALNEAGAPLANLLGNVASYLEKRAAYAEAEPLYKRSLAISEKALGPDHPSVALTLGNLAMLLATTDRLPDAVPLMRRAHSIFESALGAGHPNTVATESRLEQMEDALRGEV